MAPREHFSTRKCAKKVATLWLLHAQLSMQFGDLPSVLSHMIVTKAADKRKRRSFTEHINTLIVSAITGLPPPCTQLSLVCKTFRAVVQDEVLLLTKLQCRVMWTHSLALQEARHLKADIFDSYAAVSRGDSFKWLQQCQAKLLECNICMLMSLNGFMMPTVTQTQMNKDVPELDEEDEVDVVVFEHSLDEFHEKNFDNSASQLALISLKGFKMSSVSQTWTDGELHDSVLSECELVSPWPTYESGRNELKFEGSIFDPLIQNVRLTATCHMIQRWNPAFSGRILEGILHAVLAAIDAGSWNHLRVADVPFLRESFFLSRWQVENLSACTQIIFAIAASSVASKVQYHRQLVSEAAAQEKIDLYVHRFTEMTLSIATSLNPPRQKQARS